MIPACGPDQKTEFFLDPTNTCSRSREWLHLSIPKASGGAVPGVATSRVASDHTTRDVTSNDSLDIPEPSVAIFLRSEVENADGFDSDKTDIITLFKTKHYRVHPCVVITSNIQYDQLWALLKLKLAQTESEDRLYLWNSASIFPFYRICLQCCTQQPHWPYGTNLDFCPAGPANSLIPPWHRAQTSSALAHQNVVHWHIFQRCLPNGVRYRPIRSYSVGLYWNICLCQICWTYYNVNQILRATWTAMQARPRIASIPNCQTHLNKSKFRSFYYSYHKQHHTHLDGTATGLHAQPNSPTGPKECQFPLEGANPDTSAERFAKAHELYEVMLSVAGTVLPEVFFDQEQVVIVPKEKNRRWERKSVTDQVPSECNRLKNAQDEPMDRQMTSKLLTIS